MFACYCCSKRGFRPWATIASVSANWFFHRAGTDFKLSKPYIFSTNLNYIFVPPLFEGGPNDILYLAGIENRQKGNVTFRRYRGQPARYPPHNLVGFYLVVFCGEVFWKGVEKCWRRGLQRSAAQKCWTRLLWEVLEENVWRSVGE